MDDNFIGGGILIASEDQMDNFLESSDPFDIPTIPGRNIKTGAYGLFLVALDQCEDPLEKATLEEAIDALDRVVGCVASCALSLYYPKIDLSYEGIIALADVFIFLGDVVPGKHANEIPEEEIGKIDEQVTEMLNISMEDAIKEMFNAMGFETVEIRIDDGPRQLELEFGEPGD